MEDFVQGIFSEAASFFSELQKRICKELEETDTVGKFCSDAWERPGGGGGLTRVLSDGDVFEKCGVSWSSVEGILPVELAQSMFGDGQTFRATGISLVLHPRSPYIPTTHANLRCIVHGEKVWFGGGADLTPYYFYKDDAIHFHQILSNVCKKHGTVADYSTFKKWCDEYFYLPHRKETRGIGGIFFDHLGIDSTLIQDAFSFVCDLGDVMMNAYLPIVAAHRKASYGDKERNWQLYRRGRYVEFNLLHDRGTIFGLQTDGRTESILMSLPPLVRWDYGTSPPSFDSREARLLQVLKPIDWLSNS